MLNGLCPRFFEGKLSGEYLLDGRNALEMELADIGKLTGNVFQDPRSQFFCTDTTDEVAFAMENRGSSRSEMKERIEELEGLLPIGRLLDRSIFELSSGEKQLIAVAAACAVRPDVIIMDEPSANLDTKTTMLLADLLGSLKALGCTIIISEHRLHYLEHLFDRAILLNDGRIERELTREETVGMPHEELVALGLRLFSMPTLAPARSVTSFWDSMSGIRAEDLDYRVKTDYPLDAATLLSPYGRVLAIIGNNGAGKTTFCRALTGVIRQERGSFHFNGLRVWRKRARLKRSFFVQQDADYQLHAHTVLDEFWAGRKRINIKDAQIESAQKALESVGLPEFAERHPHSLSGGQKQRLLLALAEESQAELIVFDEPTSGLDGHNMRLTADRFRTLAARGKNVILITHDIELIAQSADSIAYMDNGRVTSRLLLDNCAEARHG